MPGLVKVIKNKAYFKRFQVKRRRRRNGVTDYYQRQRLIAQDKNKYNTKKYRLIVRITNKYVVCQIAYATISGDHIVCQANSKELTKYGITFGLSNYAAAYCTGLLCARRHLEGIKLGKQFQGNTDPCKASDAMEVDGAENEGKKPFKAILDLGLSRSSTGAKVFGAMKGAIDGGINIPCSDSRFVGYNREGDKYDAEVHRKHIFGNHVAEYMKELEESDPEKFKRHFSKYISSGITHDKIEALYKSAHEKIRESPGKVKKEKVEKPKKVFTPRQKKLIMKSKARLYRKKIANEKEEFLTELREQAAIA